MKKIMSGWLFPVGLFSVGVIYVTLLWHFKKNITFEVWWNQVIAFVFPSMIWLIIKSMIASGELETPQQTRSRKWREADAARTAQEEYEALSPEGKLLHKLTEKQAQTEANTNAIYRMMMGGAIGYLVYYFWPF